MYVFTSISLQSANRFLNFLHYTVKADFLLLHLIFESCV